MAKAKKEKPIKSIEISLHGGPLDGKVMEVVYPPWPTYVLDMGRSLYKQIKTTEYHYTEDWSIHKMKTMKDILGEE
jgi:hypothetical protein